MRFRGALSRRVAGGALSLAVASGCAGAAAAPSADRLAQQARAAAERFLATYVDADGRVVRRDQGGDTVSEGEAYAMLLAVAVGDRARFATVWAWTRTHLLRPDGLLAYHWQHGAVADATPAADADTQAAWALALAGARWHDDGALVQARRLATAVVAHEAGYDDAGHVTLAAGPWAVPSAGPVTVEPGYWTPPAAQALAALTGDGRWRAMAGADAAHLRRLTGARLPPDWALVGHGPPRPTGSPDGATPVQHGPDAMRALVWTSCSPYGRGLVAGWWRLLAGTADRAPLARTLSGHVVRDAQAPLSAVAAAAAALDAGHRSAGLALLDRAAGIDRAYPTYYGAAWVALGRVLLTTHLLADCGAR